MEAAPVYAVIAVYARENDEGMMFAEEFDKFHPSNLPVKKIPSTQMNELNKSYWYELGDTKPTFNNMY